MAAKDLVDIVASPASLQGGSRQGINFFVGGRYNYYAAKCKTFFAFAWDFDLHDGLLAETPETDSDALTREEEIRIGMGLASRAQFLLTGDMAKN